MRFEPGVWKWNEGLPCLSADCKILIAPILFKFSQSIWDWTALSWNLEGIFLKTFLEWSVGRVIYRDYIVNRRFFIYCSLACVEVCCPRDTTLASWPSVNRLPGVAGLNPVTLRVLPSLTCNKIELSGCDRQVVLVSLNKQVYIRSWWVMLCCLHH